MNLHKGDEIIGRIKKLLKIKCTNIKKEDPYKNLTFCKGMILMRAFSKNYFMAVLITKNGMGSNYVLKSPKWRQERVNRN